MILFNSLFRQIVVGLAVILGIVVGVKNPLKLRGAFQSFYYVVIGGGLLWWLDNVLSAILFAACSGIVVLIMAIINEDIK